jgi:hypothetical protein
MNVGNADKRLELMKNMTKNFLWIFFNFKSRLNHISR